MNERQALAYLKRFGLYLAEEFSGAKRGEWRCPMIGAEAATSVVEAIAVLSRIGSGNQDTSAERADATRRSEAP